MKKERLVPWPLNGRALVAATARTSALERSRANSSSKNAVAFLERRVARFREREPERQQVGGLEAWRHVLQPDEAPDQQAGGHEQHERQRDLRDDQDRSRAAVSRARAAAFLQRLAAAPRATP